MCHLGIELRGKSSGLHGDGWPATALRCGNSQATIWQNASENGPFFATTFSRPFKDQSGAWRNSTSFAPNDALKR
jgi:hypothetical protein